MAWSPSRALSAVSKSSPSSGALQDPFTGGASLTAQSTEQVGVAGPPQPPAAPSAAGQARSAASPRQYADSAPATWSGRPAQSQPAGLMCMAIPMALGPMTGPNDRRDRRALRRADQTARNPGPGAVVDNHDLPLDYSCVKARQYSGSLRGRVTISIRRVSRCRPRVDTMDGGTIEVVPASGRRAHRT